MELSILDYAMIDEGKNAQQALDDTVRLAKQADKLNYKRFGLQNITMCLPLHVVVQNY